MTKPGLTKYIDAKTLSRVRQARFEPRDLVEGNLAGGHKSPFHGFAVEFAGHRAYAPGDDPRHIDWNLYHRHDRLLIKQYEMETNFNCHLVLDVSASMRYGEGRQQKLAYASHLGSTLAYLILEQSDRISFTTLDRRLRDQLPLGNSMSQIPRIAERLDNAPAVEKTSLGPPLLELAGSIGRRGIVVLMTDGLADLDELEQALQRLRYDRHEIVIFQIMHHDELAFEFEGMVKFSGLEVAQEYLTRPVEVQRAYLDEVGKFNQRLESLCRSNGCERLLCDTSRPLAELFADYLQQRSQSHRRW